MWMDGFLPLLASEMMSVEQSEGNDELVPWN